MIAVEDIARMRENERVAIVARAICCPDGCYHPPDAAPAPYLTRLPCMSGSYRREAVAAIRAYRTLVEEDKAVGAR